jgi:hypothetical protein
MYGRVPLAFPTNNLALICSAAQIPAATPEMHGILQINLAVFQSFAGNGKPNRL